MSIVRNISISLQISLTHSLSHYLTHSLTHKRFPQDVMSSRSENTGPVSTVSSSKYNHKLLP